MDNVKITYYKKIKDEYVHLSIEGELIIGDGMFSDFVGVNEENGLTLIPMATVTKIEAKELHQMFLTPLTLYGKIKTASMEAEMNKLSGNGGNHLFG
mgnify:CR=1 FL=1